MKQVKRMSFLLVMVLLFGLVAGCTRSDVSDIPADYIALAQGETLRLGLVIPIEAPLLAPDLTKAVGFGFTGTADAGVEITDIRIEKGKGAGKYILYVNTLHGKEPGRYTIDGVNLVFESKAVAFAVRPITIEVGGDSAADYVSVWETPGACSNPHKLSCSYDFAAEVTACRVYYGESRYQDLTAAEIASGEFEIPLDYEGDGCYIRPKLELTADGQQYVAYGGGCLCGYTIQTEQK